MYGTHGRYLTYMVHNLAHLSFLHLGLCEETCSIDGSMDGWKDRVMGGQPLKNSFTLYQIQEYKNIKYENERRTTCESPNALRRPHFLEGCCLTPG